MATIIRFGYNAEFLVPDDFDLNLLSTFVPVTIKNGTYTYVKTKQEAEIILYTNISEAKKFDEAQDANPIMKEQKQ